MKVMDGSSRFLSRRMKQSSVKNLLKTLCLFNLLNYVFVPAALSDDINQNAAEAPKAPAPAQKGVHTGGSRPPVKTRSSYGEGIHEVSKAPEMPGIVFPNAKYLNGFDNQTRTGRKAGARFEVPESYHAVINSYRGNLASSGWKINEQASNEKVLFATNQRYRASVTVSTFESRNPGCQVYFTYGSSGR